jgi:hypothetical protein
VTRSIVPTESALADRCGKGRSLTLANGRFWHFGDIDAALSGSVPFSDIKAWPAYVGE